MIYPAEFVPFMGATVHQDTRRGRTCRPAMQRHLAAAFKGWTTWQRVEKRERWTTMDQMEMSGLFESVRTEHIVMDSHG